MKRTLLILGLTTQFLAGCVTSPPRVAVTRTTPSAFRVEVTEHTKDPFSHLPATRIYRVTSPVAPVVTAAEIRDYEELYTGSDGIVHEFKSPVAGYIRFPSLIALQRVEFRLVGGAECACDLRYPLSINGTHLISSRQ